MIKLKGITKNSFSVNCKAYIEDCNEPIILSFDVLTSKLNDVSLPMGYEWCKSHISHAKDYLKSLVSQNTIPESHTILWY